MTVCIAAACEQGKHVVTASDGLLSYAGITADVLTGKTYWMGDWQFLYAGSPSQIGLILEELLKMVSKEKDALSRDKIQSSVRQAFDIFVSRESSRHVLAPFGLTIDVFNKTGIKTLGLKTFTRLSEEISYAARFIANELIVVGWGDTEHACMIFSVTSQTEGSYALAPLATIGSGGGQVALSTLLLLGQARNSTLPDTLYAVAAAKFSSELSEGQGVGEKTLIHISRKRSEEDCAGHTVGLVLQPDDVHQLRALWEEHGRPKIPREASYLTTHIASRTGSISSAAMMKSLQNSLGEAHDAK
jgi:hypothetical protein